MFIWVPDASPCNLWGLSADKNIPASSYFTEFIKGSRRNPHGWGVAFFSETGWKFFKEPVAAHRSQWIQKLISSPDFPDASILIGHLRRSTIGKVAHENTHPFWHTLEDKTYVFAHNGTLKDHKQKLNIGNFKPHGETDSEHLFYHLLFEISRQKVQKWNHDHFQWFYQVLQNANKSGTLNCLFSNGEFLFVYRDVRGYNSLNFLEKSFSNQPREHLDKSNQEPAADKLVRLMMFSTRTFISEPWKEMFPGQFFVVKNGVLIFENLPDNQNYIE